MTEIEALAARLALVEQQLQVLSAAGSFWAALSIEDTMAITGASVMLLITGFLIHQARKTLD